MDIAEQLAVYFEARLGSLPNSESPPLSPRNPSVESFVENDMPELTQDRVKELFDYDPDTGVLTRKITTLANAIKGHVAGFSGGDYLQVSVKKIHYKIHRIIWLWVYGDLPVEVDHENHIGTDNRLCNLHAVDHKQNTRNQKKRSTNASGVMGVSWEQSRGKWRSGIMVDGRSIFLGYFNDIGKAAGARKKADRKYGFHANHGKS